MRATKNHPLLHQVLKIIYQIGFLKPKLGRMYNPLVYKQVINHQFLRHYQQIFYEIYAARLFKPPQNTTLVLHQGLK